MAATTIEQSNRLLACGVKLETADMSYHHIVEYNDRMQYWKTLKLIAEPFDVASDSKETITPAWSLSALLTKVLPGTISEEQEKDLKLEYDSTEVGEYKWSCSYWYSSIETWASDPIEACVKMVELLHEKGLFEKKS